MMMTSKARIVAEIKRKASFLCVGLDPDLEKLPQHLPRNVEGVRTFLKAIIQKTLPYAVAYKPNFAFFEALGPEGMQCLAEIRQWIPIDCLLIADAKRGDIGNTAAHYAKAIFDVYGADAVTLSPYMGMDTTVPFRIVEGKWSVILALTSNPGSDDFQKLRMVDGRFLWQHVLERSAQDGTVDNTMFVIGATHPDEFKQVRTIVPDYFLLVPGFGTQGGKLEEVFLAGATEEVGILANVSRDILYASSGTDFAERAAQVAAKYQEEMSRLMSGLK